MILSKETLTALLTEIVKDINSKASINSIGNIVDDYFNKTETIETLKELILNVINENSENLNINSNVSEEKVKEIIEAHLSEETTIGKITKAVNSLTNPFQTAYWKDSSDGNIYLVTMTNGALSIKKYGTEEGGSESGGSSESGGGSESGSGENVSGLEDLLEDRLLIWHDEFEGDSLNTDIWNYEYGYVRNNEPQYYQEQNITVADSICKITAKKESVTDETSGQTYNWTSGSIKTNKNMVFRYGRVEAKIRVSGVGCEFPAFWMVGMGLPWCRSGEIDVMEMWDNDFNNATFNLHWANNEGNHASIGATKYACTRNEWHIFAVEIDKQYITTYLDGVQVAQHDHTTDTYFYEQGYSSSALNPFRTNDKYIILNLAMSFSQTANGNSDRTMEIDWVRLYAATEQTENKEISDFHFFINGWDSNTSTDGERKITLSSLRTYGSSNAYYGSLTVDLYDSDNVLIPTYPSAYTAVSSNPEVVEVGEGNLSLKFLKAGTADITVTLENGMSKTRKVTLS